MLDWLVIIGLATWRLAYLLVEDDGPWDIFKKLREKYPPTESGGIGNALGCMYCMSVWMGVLCVAVWAVGGGVLLLPFAASAAGLMLANFTGVSYQSERE